MMRYRPIANKPLDSRLGRYIPDDFEHVAKWRFAPQVTATTVNRILPLPAWHWTHDQGAEGACVGFGSSMLMSILNLAQRRAAGIKPYTVRYDPWWLWDRSKEIDYWPDTNPGDDNGTSVSASMDVLRDRGHVLEPKTTTQDRVLNATPDLSHGIATNRWATTTDEMRTALALGIPVSIGVNWYSNFDVPVLRGTHHWIGEGSLGRIRGGHCVCVYGASDTRQAFRIKNSWGKDYPLVWMPYATMDRLLNEYGEATLVTDR